MGDSCLYKCIYCFFDINLGFYMTIVDLNVDSCLCFISKSFVKFFCSFIHNKTEILYLV